MAQKTTIILEAKNRTGAAFKQAEKSVGRLHNAVAGLRTGMAGFAGVVGSIALVSFVKQSLASADAVGKTADRLGIATSSLQKYRFAAEQSGISTSELDSNLQIFNKRIGDASRGVGLAKTAYEDLGIALTTSSGEMVSAETVLEQVADKMAGMATQSEKASVAQALFGVSGKKMVNLLQGGSKVIADYGDQLEKTGGIIEDSFIRNSEKANDAMNLLSKSTTALSTGAIAGLVPFITDASNAILDMVKASNQHPAIAKLSGAVAGLGTALLVFAVAGGPVTLAIAGLIGLGIAFVKLHKIMSGGKTAFKDMGIDQLNEKYQELEMQLDRTLIAYGKTRGAKGKGEESKAIWQEIQMLEHKLKVAGNYIQKIKETDDLAKSQLETSVALSEQKKREAEAQAQVTKEIEKQGSFALLTNEAYSAGLDASFALAAQQKKDTATLAGQKKEASSAIIEQKKKEAEVQAGLVSKAWEEVDAVRALQALQEKAGDILEKEKERTNEIGYQNDKLIEQYALYGIGQEAYKEAIQSMKDDDESLGEARGESVSKHKSIFTAAIVSMIGEVENLSAAEQAAQVTKIDNATATAQSMIHSMKGHNKSWFAASKALSIAETTMSTYKAATQALAIMPPPVGMAFAATITALGMANVARISQQSYQAREAGGPVTGGTTYLVGERGPELFTPNQSGGITPNNAMQGGGNVNFNIQANDARGFDQLLQARRGMIVNMISKAMNQNGRRGLG